MLNDLTGKRFGRLFIVKESGRTKAGNKQYLCKCDCGQETTVSGGNLNKENGTRSCGCLAREITRNRSIKHGQYGTPAYIAWVSAKARTTNPTDPNYFNYGGRGITMYADWLNDFQAFYDHIGPRPSQKYSLDRIDNNGNYEPGNIRWATIDVQHSNRRTVKQLEKELQEFKFLTFLLLVNY